MMLEYHAQLLLLVLAILDLPSLLLGGLIGEANLVLVGRVHIEFLALTLHSEISPLF